ncbi:universal stress protein [Halanaeroarchaeum sulfurireducens]|uniref:UspA domain-containing protein n=1 Tax=Halanaeroarchaeum sulfurireducens TaxID=1604004 RepID=A0A0F7PCI8_9EURY|nr:universal stress protein [Halanaeroarchaeum sulfurireducens]AKH98412.1 UspA domain-containing protein [Halanaeroarchaeum sulfurireducens]ALG82806.1 UspA domain-containing protein [Halanaeroarchaeum sulfurireducens]
MKTVLVPLDGSEQSWNALEFAAEEFPSATVHVLHVIDPVEAGYTATATVPGYTEEWYEQAQERADELFQQAEEELGAESMKSATEVGRPSRVIVDYAEEHGVDQIVMGSHGRSGVSRILLGSVAEAVVRRSPMPVTIIR